MCASLSMITLFQYTIYLARPIIGIATEQLFASYYHPLKIPNTMTAQVIRVTLILLPSSAHGPRQI